MEFVPCGDASEQGFENMPRRVPHLTKIHRLVGYARPLPPDETLHRVIEHTRGAILLEAV